MKINHDFTDEVVLVTGGSRGIGRAIAIAFAEQGARVAVHYRSNREEAEKSLSLLAGEGHQLFQADVSDANEVEHLIKAVTVRMGGLDVLLNNAGIYEEHPLLSTDYKEWQRQWEQILRVNLLGPANLIFCAAHWMEQHGGGRVVNISSRGAFRGEPNAPAYGASKAGMNSMSQSLAKALAAKGIFFYVVAPGFVETEMVSEMLAGEQGKEIKAQSPLNRVAQPEEVARTAVFLASKGNQFLTGTIVDVNGASYLRS